jgi:hypothetical protein
MSCSALSPFLDHSWVALYDVDAVLLPLHRQHPDVDRIAPEAHDGSAAIISKLASPFSRAWEFPMTVAELVLIPKLKDAWVRLPRSVNLRSGATIAGTAYPTREEAATDPCRDDVLRGGNGLQPLRTVETRWHQHMMTSEG